MRKKLLVLSLFLISILIISGCLSDVDSLANDMEDAWDQVDTYSVKIEKTNFFGEIYNIEKEYLKKPNKRKTIEYSSISYDDNSIVLITSIDGVNRYSYVPNIDSLIYYPSSGMDGYSQENFEDMGFFEIILELMHRYEGEIETTTYNGQEAYKIYLTSIEDDSSWRVYGDVEIWLDTEFYFPLEIKQYLREESCETLSDFFLGEGMEIQNCFSTEKYIDREINVELSDEFFNLLNEVSEETEIIESPSPGTGYGLICEDHIGFSQLSEIDSTDFIGESSFTPYLPTYLPFNGLYFAMPSQVYEFGQNYLEENFVEGDYTTYWGEELFTHPCPYGKVIIHRKGSRVYEKSRNYYGADIEYEIVKIDIRYNSNYDETYEGEEGTRGAGRIRFEQSQSPLHHYWINTKPEISNLGIGDSYIQYYQNDNLISIEYLGVEVNGNLGIASIRKGNRYSKSLSGERVEYEYENEISDIDLFWQDGDNYFTINWMNQYVHEWDMRLEDYVEVLIVEDVNTIIEMAESVQPYNPIIVIAKYRKISKTKERPIPTPISPHFNQGFM